MWEERSQEDRGRAREHREKVGRGLREKTFPDGPAGHCFPQAVASSEKITETSNGGGEHGSWRVSSPKSHLSRGHQRAGAMMAWN